jgi:hypothetical protein
LFSKNYLYALRPEVVLRFRVVHLFAGDSELQDPRLKRGPFHSQVSSGAPWTCNDPTGVIQGLKNPLSFGFFQETPQVPLVIGLGGVALLRDKSTVGS